MEPQFKMVSKTISSLYFKFFLHTFWTNGKYKNQCYLAYNNDSGALFLKIMACHFLYKKKLICKESGMPWFSRIGSQMCLLMFRVFSIVGAKKFQRFQKQHWSQLKKYICVHTMVYILLKLMVSSDYCWKLMQILFIIQFKVLKMNIKWNWLLLFQLLKKGISIPQNYKWNTTKNPGQFSNTNFFTNFSELLSFKEHSWNWIRGYHNV
jgi:hypothetical protein